VPHPFTKIIAFFTIWLGLWLPIAIPLAIALRWRPGQPITPAQKLPLLASLYLLAPPILWGLAAIEGETIADYGLPWNLSVLVSLAAGLGLGVLGLVVMLAIETLLGWVQWQSILPTQPTSKQSLSKLLTPLFLTLLLGLWVGLTEELIFRGFLFNQLQQNYAAGVAAAIASLIFALLHLVWEGKENLPQLPGLWLMGMVLVLARWLDGGHLGLAWGLHAGWIWTMAYLDATEAIVYPQLSTAWLTGLNGQPLAGLMGILFLLTTGLSLWGFSFL
jgi:uncharacterized protein